MIDLAEFVPAIAEAEKAYIIQQTALNRAKDYRTGTVLAFLKSCTPVSDGVRVIWDSPSNTLIGKARFRVSGTRGGIYIDDESTRERICVPSQFWKDIRVCHTPVRVKKGKK